MPTDYLDPAHEGGQGEALTPNTRRIRELNDTLRTADNCGDRLRANGEIVITRGLIAQGGHFVARAIEAVRRYRAFSADNDPYGEHDFGAFELDRVQLNWKIDYFDLELEFASDDPGDPAKTRRVLTILLADEH